MNATTLDCVFGLPVPLEPGLVALLMTVGVVVPLLGAEKKGTGPFPLTGLLAGAPEEPEDGGGGEGAPLLPAGLDLPLLLPPAEAGLVGGWSALSGGLLLGEGVWGGVAGWWPRVVCWMGIMLMVDGIVLGPAGELMAGTGGDDDDDDPAGGDCTTGAAGLLLP